MHSKSVTPRGAGPGQSRTLRLYCLAAFCRYADSHYRGCRDTVTAIKQLTWPDQRGMEAAPAAGIAPSEGKSTADDEVIAAPLSVVTIL